MSKSLYFILFSKNIFVGYRILIWQYIYMCVYIYIYIYEGNGNPLQYSSLENPVDRGAWWATVDGVEKSQT